MVNYLSKSGISYFQRRKKFHIHNGNLHLPKLEKPFLHVWLTTYPKAEFYISKEGKIQWKIDFQTWICSMQRWNAYFLNVDNQEILNLVACGKFLMIYPCLVDILFHECLEVSPKLDYRGNMFPCQHYATSFPSMYIL